MLERLPFPVLCLGYDGMLKDPHDAVRRLSMFLELPCDECFIEAAVKATTFERLKAYEEAEFQHMRETRTGGGRFTGGRRMPALEHGYRFFSTGKSGNFRTLLDREMIVAAEKVFGEVAGELGYTFESSDL